MRLISPASWALAALLSPACFCSGQTFDITAFGGLPDDGVDDTAALRAAVAAAEASAFSSVTVSLPGGVYDFFDPSVVPPYSEPAQYPLWAEVPPDREALLSLSGSTKDWKFRGSGTRHATMKMHGFDPTVLSWAAGVTPSQGAYPKIFSFFDCTGTMIFNRLTIGFGKLPFMEGFVVAKSNPATPSQFWVEIEVSDPDMFLPVGQTSYWSHGFALYPASHPLALQPKGPFYLAIDYRTTDPLDSENLNATATVVGTSTGKQRIRLSLDPSLNPFLNLRLDVGDPFVAGHVFEATRTFEFVGCENVELLDVTVNSQVCDGMLTRRHGGDLTLRNVTVAPEKGRWHCAPRGWGLFGDVGGDILFDNFNTCGLGDDSINVFHTWLVVDGVDAANNTVDLALSGGWWTKVESGDRLRFVAADNDLTELGEAIVVSRVANPSWSPVAGTLTLQPVQTGLLQGVQPGDRVLNLTRGPDSMLVENCTFENGIAFGVRCGIQDAVVRNNTFRGLGNGAVLLQSGAIQPSANPAINNQVGAYAAGNWEGGLPHGVVFEHNEVISAPSAAFPEWATSAVIVNVAYPGTNGPNNSQLSLPSPAIRNVTIRNNVFSDLLYGGIAMNSVGGTAGAVIRENVFHQSNLANLSQPNPWFRRRDDVIHMNYCVGGSVQSNVVTGGYDTALFIDPGTSSGVSTPSPIASPGLDGFGVHRVAGTSGCAGSTGETPQLRGLRPTLANGVGGPLFTVTGLVPGGPTTMHIGIALPAGGVDLGPTGAPGCFMFVDPIVAATFIGSPVSASIDFPLTIPASPSLVGGVLDFQAIQVDLPANALGVTLSDHVQAVIEAP